MRVRRVGLALLFSFLGVGTPAYAQTGGVAPAPPRLDRSFDVQLFHSAVGPGGFITLDGAEVLEHRLWYLGLVGSYARAPLEYTLRDAQSTESTTLVPMRNLAMAELVGAVGIRNRFEIGMALPVALAWQGDAFDSYGRGTGLASTAAGLGDLRVEGKAEVVGFGGERALLLSLSVGATLPTGDETAFLGERTVAARARALLEYQWGQKLRAVAMAGGLVREKSQFLGTPEGSTALYGAALEVRPTPELGVVGEVTGRYASRYSDTNPAELDAGMRFYLPSMVRLLMGAGLGLNQGIGSPRVRAFVGLGWSPDNRDRDGDGIIDRKDHCPDEAEDRDGFQDEDGCPDPDNDGDGVADLYDACPSAKEDGLGKKPTDGCPSTTEDADGDGIPDAADRCPEEAEDKDGWEDEDGCPDYDNDGDGIPDVYDACPNQAEDLDGFEDTDGCPDPDNDHDGFPDSADKCPNQPETINYYKDEDGCPDPGPELVRLGENDDKIYLAEHINFRMGAAGKPQLTMNGNMMVALVARVLVGHVEVSKVHIEVQGKDASRELTQARGEVVLAALVKNGIDPSRLEVVALGPGPNRVDFVIQSRTWPRPMRKPVPAEGTAAPDPSPSDTGPGSETAAPPADAAPAAETARPHEEAP